MATWQTRIVGRDLVDPLALKAHDKNFRNHPMQQRKAVEASLADIGHVGDIIVSRRTGTILNGHLRVELAIGRGEGEVPVTYLDVTPQEEVIILAFFDRVGEGAKIDGDRLRAAMGDLDFGDLQSTLDEWAASYEKFTVGRKKDATPAPAPIAVALVAAPAPTSAPAPVATVPGTAPVAESAATPAPAPTPAASVADDGALGIDLGDLPAEIVGEDETPDELAPVATPASAPVGAPVVAMVIAPAPAPEIAAAQALDTAADDLASALGLEPAEVNNEIAEQVIDEPRKKGKKAEAPAPVATTPAAPPPQPVIVGEYDQYIPAERFNPWWNTLVEECGGDTPTIIARVKEMLQIPADPS